MQIRRFCIAGLLALLDWPGLVLLRRGPGGLAVAEDGGGCAGVPAAGG